MLCLKCGVWNAVCLINVQKSSWSYSPPPGDSDRQHDRRSFLRSFLDTQRFTSRALANVYLSSYKSQRTHVQHYQQLSLSTSHQMSLSEHIKIGRHTYRQASVFASLQPNIQIWTHFGDGNDCNKLLKQGKVVVVWWEMSRAKVENTKTLAADHPSGWQ